MALKLTGSGGQPEALLTVKQVADQLGVSSASVYKLCASGLLPHTRILNALRIAAADLETFISKQRSDPQR